MRFGWGGIRFGTTGGRRTTPFTHKPEHTPATLVAAPGRSAGRVTASGYCARKPGGRPAGMNARSRKLYGVSGSTAPSAATRQIVGRARTVRTSQISPPSPEAYVSILPRTARSKRPKPLIAASVISISPRHKAPRA